MRIVLTVAAVLIALPSAAQDVGGLCASEHALRLNSAPYACHSRLISFLAEGSVHEIEMASVTTGSKTDRDLVSTVETYLLHLPTHEIMQVDALPAMPTVNMAEQPGFELLRVQPELLYEYKAYELVSGRLCAATKLKHPFIGKARNCEKEARERHPLQLASRVITPAAARAKVCRSVSFETADCKGVRGVELVKTELGELTYQVGARIRLGTPFSSEEQPLDLANTSIDYEERVYRISLDGRLSLPSASKETCTHSHAVRSQKRTLTPQALCEPVSADDLCQATEVRKIKQTGCSTSWVPLRSGGKITTIQVATVGTGIKASFDLIEATAVYVVRQPDGKDKRLETFPFFDNEYSRGIGTAFVSLNAASDVMYETKLAELIADQYCGTYIGRYPFVGEVTYCGGLNPERNTLGYAPGVTSAADARKRICSIVEAETSEVCNSNAGGVYSNELAMRDGGELTYRLMARIVVRSCPELKHATSYGWTTPLEFDQRIYEVRLNGEVTLVERTRIPCSSE